MLVCNEDENVLLISCNNDVVVDDVNDDVGIFVDIDVDFPIINLSTNDEIVLISCDGFDVIIVR